MTFLLSRTNTGVTQGGVMSIGMPQEVVYMAKTNVAHTLAGELVSNLTHIKEAPKLPVLTSTGWLTLSDGVMANGKHHAAHTIK